MRLTGLRAVEQTLDSVSFHLSCRITWLCTGPRTRLLQIFFHRKTKRRPADSLCGHKRFCLSAHDCFLPCSMTLHLLLQEDKLNYLAHHLWVQCFKNILPTMEHANACSNRTGFVMSAMPGNDNIMPGKENSGCPLLPGVSSLLKGSSHMCWILPSVLEDVLVEKQEPLVSPVWWMAEATVAAAVLWVLFTTNVLSRVKHAWVAGLWYSSVSDGYKSPKSNLS